MFETISHWYIAVGGGSDTCGRSPPPVTTQPTGFSVPDIPGLDASDGLNRVAGNRRLYLDLLHRFVEGQAAAADAVDAALAAGDRLLAERLAHTAKGVSGNLGAHGLSEAAGQLESSIRHGDPSGQTREILARFAVLLGETVAGHQGRVTGTTGTAGGGTTGVRG